MQWTYDKWTESGKTKTVVCGLYREVIQARTGPNNLTHWWLEDGKYVYSQRLNTKTMQYEDSRVMKPKFYKQVQSRKIKLSTIEMEDWCDIMLKINAMTLTSKNHSHVDGWFILEDIKACNQIGTKLGPSERQAYYLQTYMQRKLIRCNK